MKGARETSQGIEPLGSRFRAVGCSTYQLTGDYWEQVSRAFACRSQENSVPGRGASCGECGIFVFDQERLDIRNTWGHCNPAIKPDLMRANLSGVDFRVAKLDEANLARR